MTMPADWGRLSRAERDAAYDNGKAVPDAPAISERRREASAAFRARHPAALDLAYAEGDRPKWDLFPAGSAEAPCLVFIHGGYWQLPARREWLSAVAAGVMAHGWSAALPGYAIAPEASMTSLVAQLTAGFDWFAANAAQHGISGPVVVAGHSAGGHLAALMAAHPRVSAALPISGVFELGPIRDIYLNDKLQLTDEEVERFSPLRLPVVAKPMTLAYGTRELAALVADSRALHARRAAAHAPGALLPVAGANHFDILGELEAPDGLLTRAALELARPWRTL